MKNDSPLFPFNMPGDSFFDSNKDGKLTGFETIMRDSHHLEMMNKANQEGDHKEEKMLELRQKLAKVEKNRHFETNGYTVNELDEILDKTIHK